MPEERKNMDPAHNLLYVMCIVQGALVLYRIMLLLTEKRIVKQVSQAYGFQDDDRAISGYLGEINKGCFQKPSSARERNLITYAVELMESKSPLSCLSGTLILDRLLTRQHREMIEVPNLVQQEEQQQQLELEDKTGCPLVRKEVGDKKREEKKRKMQERKKRQQQQQTEGEIIVQQGRVIKRLIFGSASSSHILEKLLHTFDSRRSYNTKMREAAMRILEHIGGEIRLEQFPRLTQRISSLINTFEEYRLLQPEPDYTSPLELDSESELHWDSIDQQFSSKALGGYKEMVLAALRVLWSLAGSEDNCTIIIKTKHLVSKIMAPISYDLVQLADHSAWSTMVVERSLGVMLRLIVTAERDAMTNLLQQIYSCWEAMSTIERIATCEECKGEELQMKAMQILAQICMENTANTNLFRLLVRIFVNGDSSNCYIRKNTGKILVVLLLGNRSITKLPKEEIDEFVGVLAKILLHVGDDDRCRKSAAKILEHLCIQYAETESAECLSILKNVMLGVMPKVLTEILLGYGSTGEAIARYSRPGTDIESQLTTNNDKKKNNSTFSLPRQNKHHKLHVALLSLCVTACDKLDLDLDAISMGEAGDRATNPGECVAFSLAMKMVQLNRDSITTDSLIVMKLTARMVIAAMKKLRGHNAGVDRANLESRMDSLSTDLEAMLDFEGCMVFSTRTRKTVPATVDTLNSLVKQALQLHREIKDQDSEIEPAS